jgi:hypothetical protein
MQAHKYLLPEWKMGGGESTANLTQKNFKLKQQAGFVLSK